MMIPLKHEIKDNSVTLCHSSHYSSMSQFFHWYLIRVFTLGLIKSVKLFDINLWEVIYPFFLRFTESNLFYYLDKLPVLPSEMR